MMFPLWTRVTDFRPLSIAYRIAFRTRRFEPVSLTGLTPIPLSGRTRAWNSLSRISTMRRASGEPLPLDAGVDVLGAFAEDDDVESFRMGDGARDAGDPVNGPHVRIEIERSPQRYIQGAEAAAHRRGQRSLRPDDVLPDRSEGGFREHVAI